MTLRRVLVFSMLALAVAALAQALYWAPQLPERMASHFDMSDRANGWMGRTPFLVLHAFLMALMVGVFLGLPLLIERLPDAFINVPHKDYWLAPVRRAESLRHVSAGLLAIGCVTLLLLLVIFQAVYALNTDLLRGAAAGGGGTGPGDVAATGGADGGAPVLVLPLPFLAVMGLYLTAVAVVLVWMLRRFRKPV